MQLYSIMRISSFWMASPGASATSLREEAALLSLPAPDRLAPLHAAPASDRSCTHVFDPACAACREAFLKIVLPVPKRKPA